METVAKLATGGCGLSQRSCSDGWGYGYDADGWRSGMAGGAVGTRMADLREQQEGAQDEQETAVQWHGDFCIKWTGAGKVLLPEFWPERPVQRENYKEGIDQTANYAKYAERMVFEENFHCFVLTPQSQL